MRRRFWVFPILLIVIVLVVVAFRAPPETRAFRMYFFKPIPESVKDIRLDVSGWAHVLRFKISHEDVALILRSTPFQEVDWFSYRKGDLYTGFSGSGGGNPRENPLAGVAVRNMPMYDHGAEPPGWFRPDEWRHRKIYRTRQKWGRSSRDHDLVLIYNDLLGEAYFISYIGG